MKKVVAFVGSPRKNGNTVALVAQAVRGAEAVGAQTKVFYLNDMQIRPCQSCMTCRKEYTCPIEDDMKAVYPGLSAADAVIIGSPVYMFQVSAQTKTLFDRMFPLMDSRFCPRFGEKSTLMIYSQGNPDSAGFRSSFDTNAAVLKVMGLKVKETLVCANANHLDTASQDSKLMARAFEAGKKLVE